MKLKISSFARIGQVTVQTLRFGVAAKFLVYVV
jgi:hypothetical protein